MSGHLTADRTQLERFVSALFTHADEGGFVSMRSFEHERGKPPVEIRAVQINGQGLAPVIAQATGAANRAARHATPAVFAPPICTFTSSARAAEADVLNGVALSLECDEQPERARQRLEGLLGPATVVVASGGEWADPETGELQGRLHCHWRLAEATRTVEEHAALKRARRLAVALAGGDPSAVPLVHPLRWPGSWHRKGKPKLCSIVALRQEVEIDLADALERLEQAGHLALEHATGADRDRLLCALEKSRERRGDGGGAHDPEARDPDLEALADAIPNEAEPRAEYISIGLAFFAASDGSPAGLNAWDRWARKSEKYHGGTARQWQHFATSPPDRTGKGSLVQRARRHEPGFRLPSWRRAEGPGEDVPLGGGEPPMAGSGDLSHDALALDVGKAWDGGARYVDRWGKWLLWSETHWCEDDRRAVWTMTRSFVRRRATGLEERLAAKLRSAETVAAVVNLARSNPEIASGVAEWDRDLDLMGTPGGTIDLRTGELRQARPEAAITKLTAVAPAPPGTPAPLWEAFLGRIFRHAPEVIPFLQRALGMALSGEVRDHVLFFCWGQGGNGKGVLLNTVSRLLGGYAAVAPSDLLLVSQNERHPCDMAMLRGARFVTAQEVGAGKAWDEPKLKSLTGGDPITARFMRQDFFTFTPQFTLFVAGNHKPTFRGVDEAIRRRVLLLPFSQNIPPEERDRDLPEKLKAEWPAILRWAIDGCLMWQKDGLDPPACVRAATDDYLNAEDILGQWLEECCTVVGGETWTALADLYGSWKVWCEARGQRIGDARGLARKLDERGFQRWKKPSGAGFFGLLVAKAARNDDDDDSHHDPRHARVRAHTHTPDARHASHRHHRHSTADMDDDEGIDL